MVEEIIHVATNEHYQPGPTQNNLPATIARIQLHSAVLA